MPERLEVSGGFEIPASSTKAPPRLPLALPCVRFGPGQKLTITAPRGWDRRFLPGQHRSSAPSEGAYPALSLDTGRIVVSASLVQAS